MKEDVQKFAEMTGVPATVAESILNRNNGDLEASLNDFYNGPTQHPSSHRPANNNPSKGGKKFKSFQDLVNGGGSDTDDEQNFFAGGGRGSGLEVENPNTKNLINDLLKKAETGGEREGDGEGLYDHGSDSEDKQHTFEGNGYRLGDASTPTTVIPQSGSSRPSAKLEKVVRQITFWKDGFQVGDGELFRYDDPKNSVYLSELNKGRAPLALLDVKIGQEVDVNVMKKLDEEFKPPKRKIEGFHGSGHRLGSTVPDFTGASVAAAAAAAPQDPAVPAREEEDDSLKDTQVQVRLADGRRVVRRVNSTDPVSVLFDYVKTQSGSRSFSLNYSFPLKPIDDLTQSIAQAGLKNSVVVQRWL